MQLRELALGGAELLTTLVAGASNLEEAQELVNCEISLGDISPLGFRICDSTLPYRAGDHLDQSLVGDVLTIRDRERDGRFTARRWSITAAEGDLAALRVG